MASAVLALLTGTSAVAETRTIVCQFPPGSRIHIMPQITLRIDDTTGNTRVSDALIQKQLGSPVQAEVQEIRRDRAVIRRIYSWRVEGLPRSTSYFGYVDFALKVEVDGRAFIETPFVVVKKEVARGRCA